MPWLIALSGLPGVGKTTIARLLAQRIGAQYLRVDSIETALKASTLRIEAAEDAGYRVLAAVARDNLGLGCDVIADTVNPIALTRQLWAETAGAAGARLLDVEIICSDPDEHRRRIETRQADLPGHVLPDWQAVLDRDYHPWAQPVLTLDTAILGPEQSVDRIVDRLG